MPVSSPFTCFPVEGHKSDGSLRVCGDYKAITERIEDDVYKLPNIQDMFGLLSQNGTVPDTFSVIDLASAFN